MSNQYVQLADITNLIDAVQLTACTDDAGAGSINMTVFNNICLMASNKADSLVSSIYAVPFPLSTIPPKIKDATIAFACYALFQRRLTPLEHNPYKIQQDYWVDTLTKINAGQLSLDSNFTRDVAPIVSNRKFNRNDSNFF